MSFFKRRGRQLWCAALICFKIVNEVVSEAAFLVRAHTFKFAKTQGKKNKRSNCIQQ